MLALNLPPFEAKITEEQGKSFIYDFLRKRYVRLTPEEWVRQHFVHYLIHHLSYPKTLLANEVSICLNGMSRRCDTVVYQPKTLKPLLIVEYKSPEVKITQAVFNQIIRYNSVLQVPFLIVSNGLEHYAMHYNTQENQLSFLNNLPAYQDLFFSNQ